MGKRSEFEVHPRNYYPTPLEATLPLKKHLMPGTSFCEPCAGDGRLVEHLEGFDIGLLNFFACDIEPRADWIMEFDANNLSEREVEYCDMIITNPPFDWKMLKPLMDKFISLRPTVLLLPADFMHNVRFSPYLNYCYKIVTIGRVKWVEGSKSFGKENYAWYFFNKRNDKHTEFFGRD